jgi:hypothetical protein
MTQNFKAMCHNPQADVQQLLPSRGHTTGTNLSSKVRNLLLMNNEGAGSSYTNLCLTYGCQEERFYISISHI